MSSVKAVRQTEQAATSLSRLSGDGSFDRRVVAQRSKRHCDSKGRCGSLDRTIELNGAAKAVSGLKMTVTRVTLGAISLNS